MQHHIKAKNQLSCRDLKCIPRVIRSLSNIVIDLSPFWEIHIMQRRLKILQKNFPTTSSILQLLIMVESILYTIAISKAV